MAKKKLTSVVKLLETLRQKRDADQNAAEFPQRIGAPDRDCSSIPTLKADHVIRASPLLRERFRFCGEWRNASVGMTWLSISAMTTASRNRKVKELIGIRQQYWGGSAPQVHPPEKLSLFGIDLDNQSEMYLIWPDHPGREPKLIWYVAQHSHEFPNLREYLLFLLGKRSVVHQSP